MAIPSASFTNTLCIYYTYDRDMEACSSELNAHQNMIIFLARFVKTEKM